MVVVVEVSVLPNGCDGETVRRGGVLNSDWNPGEHVVGMLNPALYG